MNSARTGEQAKKQSAIDEDEPDPKPEGRKVHPKLIKFLRQRGYRDAVTFVRVRAGMGYEKYGQYLHTDDGRDGVVDALQELADAIQYIAKARMNGRDLDELRPVVEAISELMADESLDGDESEGGGLAEIVGEWPGDESDEEIKQALEDLS